MNKPQLVVDLDGVIADIATALMKLNGYEEFDPESLIWNDPRFGTSIWKMLTDTRLYDVMRPYPNAKEVLRRLSVNYFITIATHRPHAARNITVNWLYHHDIRFHNYMQVEEKYKAGPFLIIEDRLNNVVDYANNAGTAILVDRPWNREGRDVKTKWPIHIAHSWYEIESIIRGC